MPRLLQRFPKLWLESPLLLTYWKQFSLVSREMARPHLKSHKKRVPHGITKTTTEAQEQENILKRDFSAQRPLEKFLTDITEVQCADGKLYVSPIMDCFNGEIVALEMRDNMKKELCIDTVRQLGRIYPNLANDHLSLSELLNTLTFDIERTALSCRLCQSRLQSPEYNTESCLLLFNVLTEHHSCFHIFHKR